MLRRCWCSFASLAVNLRMAMYSAALTPHLGQASRGMRALVAYLIVDQIYVMAQAEYEAKPNMSLPAKLAYFLGAALVIFPLWYGFTWLGAITGSGIPPELALDFALPIVFIAMIAPALRTWAHIAAAFTSIVLALALAWMPSGMGLILAGLAAMHVGARVETMMETRA